MAAQQRQPEHRVFCGACQLTELDEPGDLPSGERQPSLCCGSLLRHHTLSVHDSAESHETSRFRAKRPSQKKPFLEGVRGDDLHRDSGLWMRLQRTIDRDNDWYEEKVVNPETGEVVHQCAEPLSAHRGHGSAKRS